MNDTLEEQRCFLCGKRKLFQKHAVACTDCMNEVAEAIEMYGEDELERWAELRYPRKESKEHGT